MQTVRSNSGPLTPDLISNKLKWIGLCLLICDRLGCLYIVSMHNSETLNSYVPSIVNVIVESKI